MNFYDEVKRLCKVRGITIDALMKMTGKSSAVYFGWKQRGDYPRADDVYEISKILEVSMEHFFENDRGIVVNDRIINVVQNLERLSDAELDIINNLTENQLKNLINLAKSMQS